MKPTKNLYHVFALVAATLSLGACATTTTENELVIIPANSTENIPTLADGLKLEDNSDEKVSDES